MPNDDQKMRPGETLDDFTARMFDAALVRLGLVPAPAPAADSFEQIEKDFPELFGKPTT